MDPIKKLVASIDKENHMYGLVLRESKELDVYWNYHRIDSPQGSKGIII